MNKLIAVLITSLVLFSACEKDKVIQLNLKGSIKGTIITIDEYGRTNYDYENVLVELEGSEPLISALTDSTGNYELNNIPSGTYNLVANKEGYGEYQAQGIQIVGGDLEFKYIFSIHELSSTTIEYIELKIIDSQINLISSVNHEFPANSTSYNNAFIRYFIHTDANPSNTHYLMSDIISFNMDTEIIDQPIRYLNNSLYPSGTTIYVIAYGDVGSFSYYYDILTNNYINPCLGPASNIASITIP